LNDAETVFNEIKGMGFYVGKIDSMLTEARTSLQSNDYEAAATILNEIVVLKEKILDVNSAINILEEKIRLANLNGVATPESSKLLLFSKLALERGEVDSAISSLSEANSTFALETKGEFNAFVLLVRNWQISMIVFALIGLGIVSFALYRRKKWLLSSIRRLKNEEVLLLTLIKEEQRKCFVDSTISLQQYRDTVKQHEERLSNVVSDIVRMETLLKNLFVFRHSMQGLLIERNHLLELVKKLQSDYFESQNIDAVVYDAKQSIFLQRLSEIEEKLALSELKKILRLNGKNKFFWKTWYGGKGNEV